MGFAKYIDAFGVQIKNNWVRAAVYRTNFLTSVIVDLMWILVEFSLFTIIYANVPTIAGWTKPQVYFFLGIFFASDALFSIFFMTNFWKFSDLVNKGELDILLTKPMHPLFLSLTRSINITNIFNFGLGIALLIRYADPAGFEGGWRWLWIPVWLAIGLYVSVLIRFLFSIWIFWTERGWALARLYYQFYNMATKPDTMFPKTVRYTLMTALPFAFIGSVPARAVLHGLKPWEYGALAFVLIVFSATSHFLWVAGLKRYQSASS